MITEAATIEAFVVPMPESEHPPTDVESTKASSVSIAPAPFNNVDLDADLIFRTSLCAQAHSEESIIIFC